MVHWRLGNAVTGLEMCSLRLAVAAKGKKYI
jgi:hypothetical protein